MTQTVSAHSENQSVAVCWLAKRRDCAELKLQFRMINISS